MKIKKFKAGNFSEALTIVKKELGEDAIILSSSQLKDGKESFVEVLAAVEYDNEPYKRYENGTAMGDSIIGNQKGYEEEKRAGKGYFDVQYEIKMLRNMLEEMKNRGYGLSLPVEKMEIFHFLKERTIFEEFAFRICEKARDIEEVSEIILSDLKGCKNTDDTKRIIMLIGTTGVGKTTTIAKLAARAIRSGKRISIVSLDTYRIGAIEQMRIYARIMGVPFEVVSDIKALNSVLNKYSDKDQIFIDTTGRNPLDENYIKSLKQICLEKDIQTHLLLSLNSSSEFLLESYKYYSKVPVDFIAFTKADEAVRFGTIYNMSILYKKPVAYMTTGQSVPDDIEFPEVEELAFLTLKCGQYKKSSKSQFMEDLYDFGKVRI
jgi:flagellar biosynthesis protein FlhF